MRRDRERDATAWRRLERLGQDLADAGLRPGAAADGAETEVVPDGDVVLAPGRHLREHADEPRFGLRAGLAERLPRLPRYGASHLAVVAVAVALALGFAAWVVVRSAPTAVPAPVASTTRSGGRPTSTVTTVPSGGSASATGLPAGTPLAASASTVVVDVTGKVRRPGIVRLAVGSRVSDALRRAGGARRGVDLSNLNLARRLEDGEQVVVGGTSGRGSATGPAPASSSSDPAAVVALNTATLEQLDTLPGVGPVTAQKILDWRTAHGRFSSVDELLEVDGIGTKTMADIAPHVTL
jgi:competence protein ComEA